MKNLISKWKINRQLKKFTRSCKRFLKQVHFIKFSSNDIDYVSFLLMKSFRSFLDIICKNTEYTIVRIFVKEMQLSYELSILDKSSKTSGFISFNIPFIYTQN